MHPLHLIAPSATYPVHICNVFDKKISILHLGVFGQWIPDDSRILLNKSILNGLIKTTKPFFFARSTKHRIPIHLKRQRSARSDFMNIGTRYFTNNFFFARIIHLENVGYIRRDTTSNQDLCKFYKTIALNEIQFQSNMY